MNGRRLAWARRRAGLTQRQLAARSGVPQPTIARIEATRTTPRLDTMERLLAACGYQLEITEREGEQVDGSLLRELLSLTPAERARLATADVGNLP